MRQYPAALRRSCLNPSVGFAVVVCLLACSGSSPWSPIVHVSAQTVSIKVYSDPNCQTLTGTGSSSAPANGQCTSSTKLYCDNGQFLTYDYYDTACTQLKDIQYNPVGPCVNAGYGQSNIFTCPAGAAVPPITFPPANDGTWSYISTCADNACSAGCQVKTARKLGVCYTDFSMKYGRTVQACTADGSSSVRMTYNASTAGGSTCNGNPFYAEVRANNVCSGGVYVSCPAATSVPLPPLPAIGSLTYASSDATCSMGPLVMEVFSPSACINGATTYSCSGSGASLSSDAYYSSTSAGACIQPSGRGNIHTTNQCASSEVYNCSLSVASFLAARAAAAAASPTIVSSSSSAGAAAGNAVSSSTAASGSSTGGSSTPSGYDPTVWLGTYTASGCDQSRCCCARTSTVTASGDLYIVTGTDLAGQCGTSVPASVQASAPTPTSDAVTYSINGQVHTAQRQSDGSIVDTNTVSASCSATLTKSSINSAGARSAPFQPFHPFAVLLVSAVAAIVAF